MFGYYISSHDNSYISNYLKIMNMCGIFRALLNSSFDHSYENTPIPIYRKFHLQNTENFQIKNSDIFHISAQNIDCEYSLEPPRRDGSNEYPQSMF